MKFVVIKNTKDNTFLMRYHQEENRGDYTFTSWHYCTNTKWYPLEFLLKETYDTNLRKYYHLVIFESEQKAKDSVKYMKLKDRKNLQLINLDNLETPEIEE